MSHHFACLELYCCSWRDLKAASGLIRVPANSFFRESHFEYPKIPQLDIFAARQIICNQIERSLNYFKHLMLNETGVIIALVPGHFMFVLLPLWGAIAAIDPNLGWAAGTLGARRWQVFRHVVLPLTWPALVTGLVINFIMNMTAFAAPAILGGARTLVVSVLAYQVNLEQLNWPLGSAIAVALLAFTLALVGVGQRLAVRR